MEEVEGNSHKSYGCFIYYRILANSYKISLAKAL